MKLCGVSLLLCSGAVDSALLTLCASNGILVLSCVPQPSLDACQRLSNAVDVASLDYLLPSYVGRARCRLLAPGWGLYHSAQRTSHRPTDAGDSCQLLLCPIAEAQPRTAVSVLSSHSSTALCHQFSFHFWHGLHRVRNAAQDRWRLWKGGGATEVEWIRHLAAHSVGEAETEQGDLDADPDAGLYRPLVADLFADVLRSYLTRCVCNTDVSQSRAEAILLRYHSTQALHRCAPLPQLASRAHGRCV